MYKIDRLILAQLHALDVFYDYCPRVAQSSIDLALIQARYALQVGLWGVEQITGLKVTFARLNNAGRRARAQSIKW